MDDGDRASGPARASCSRARTASTSSRWRGPSSASSSTTPGRPTRARSPHFHERHTDAFYVLEGKLEFTLGRETHPAGPGTAVVAPPGESSTPSERGPRPCPLPERPRARRRLRRLPRAPHARARRPRSTASTSTGRRSPASGTVRGPGEARRFTVGTGEPPSSRRPGRRPPALLARRGDDPAGDERAAAPLPPRASRLLLRPRGHARPSRSTTTRCKRRRGRSPARRPASSTRSPTGRRSRCAS